MQRLSTRPKYTYKHGDVSFIFDSFTYESGTKVSDYEILLFDKQNPKSVKNREIK